MGQISYLLNPNVNDFFNYNNTFIRNEFNQILGKSIIKNASISFNSNQVTSTIDFSTEVFNSMLEEHLNISKEEMLGKGVDEKLIKLILINREGKIKFKPGYDGEYGKAIMGDKQNTLI